MIVHSERHIPRQETAEFTEQPHEVKPMTLPALAKLFKTSPEVIQEIAKEVNGNVDFEFEEHAVKGIPRRHVPARLVTLIERRMAEPPPSGWKPLTYFGNAVKETAPIVRMEHPEWFGRYRVQYGNQTIYLHYAPESLVVIEEYLKNMLRAGTCQWSPEQVAEDLVPDSYRVKRAAAKTREVQANIYKQEERHYRSY